MLPLPDIPRYLFHGGFWPIDHKINPLNGLFGEGLLSASEDPGHARYFAHLKRRARLNKPGELLLFRIDTSQLTQEVKESAIAPYEDGSRVFGKPQYGQFWINERISIREWTFAKIVPWPALKLECRVYKKSGMR
jgi:hypothetical protein